MRTARLPASVILPPRPFYGAHVLPSGGVVFRVFSHHASRVFVQLFSDPAAAKPMREIELARTQGDIFAAFDPDARAGNAYLLRAEGPDKPGFRFNPAQPLLDPYALCVVGRETWGAPIETDEFPKCLILPPDDFDWGEDVRPHIALEDAVVYEISVRGYTASPTAGVRESGTYRGLIEKLPYIKSLGVNVIELLPIHEFDEMEFVREGGPRKALRNFWGYSTVAFFSPMARFASKSLHGEHLRDLKELVKAAHAQGMEVMLDVVYNHTAEGGMGGKTYSFRGLDNTLFYMLEDDMTGYKNFTGCGNTVNCNHPAVADLIVDSLRYWAGEFHIDGFRFDLATILTRARNSGEELFSPPVVERIATDPALRGVKLVAEAWDAAGCYQVGRFPNRHWSEWNGRYRDDMRSFWRGDDGRLGDFSTRLCGSADLYDRPGQGPLKSINFLSCHDGFTLADITSYEQKHNEANCEDNRDGDNNNHSSNGGVEGETADRAILARRERRRMNMIATLLLSQGVPMLLGGDEFARTQDGNNNAYCQDNPISWVDWSLQQGHRTLLEFTRAMVSFRLAHPALRRKEFLLGRDPADESDDPDIRWYGPQPCGGQPDWKAGKCLACRLDGRKNHTGADRDDDHLFLIFNAGTEPATFVLPTDSKEAWRFALSTQDKAVKLARDIDNRPLVTVDGESVTVFTAPCLSGKA